METRRPGRTWINEPVTALTDLILSAMAVYFAVHLGRQQELGGMKVHLYFSRAFWALGLGAFLGAVTHGIGRHLSVEIGRLIWRVTLLSLGAAAFFLILAVARHAFPARHVPVFEWSGVVMIALYAIIILRDDRFLWAVIFYSAALLIVLAAMLHDLVSGVREGPGLVVAGILVSFAAAIVQRSGLSLHRHFNHNDLYHVVQSVGLYYLYRGAMLLKDWPSP
ncbi:MAG TPA: hypothetical protein P5551_05180 [Syntrophales bacterium]|jgi:hypothetical protein|nr:hypothetical protein [Syntrophales bacterium]HRT61740.1 hypothetical protein [Syntrophales bacterium]